MNMQGINQFVSLVSRGGVPMMLVDSRGNPYPTTGFGALAFNRQPVLENPRIQGSISTLNGAPMIDVNDTGIVVHGNIGYDGFLEGALPLSPVVPGTYGDTNNAVQFTVDQSGRLTFANYGLINAPLVAGTVAELRSFPLRPSSMFTRSYMAPNDGGGGLWTWDATDTTSVDNGGTIVTPIIGPPGRWKRVYSGGRDVRWFGARAD